MATKGKVFYKMTTREGGQYTSLLVAEKDSRVVYKPRQWASPRAGCGPLCVFDTLQAALEFRPFDPCEGTDVWSCTISPSKARGVWDGQKRCTEVKWLPCGTILADKVKLTKRIHKAKF